MGRGNGQMQAVAPARRGSSYKASFSRAVKALPEELLPANGEEHSGRIPSQAATDFVQHQARGHWAEALVRDLFAGEQLQALPYGHNEDIIAGEPGFKKYYSRYLEELEKIGKRCDLLILPPGKELRDSDASVREALAGLEVRSSAQTVKLYYDAMEKGVKTSRARRGFLSFTVKAGDVAAIARWVSSYGVRHNYVQVFEDHIYAIDTLEALRLLADPEQRGKAYTIEKNGRNQFKNTVHIDIGQGTLVATIVETPTLVGKQRVLPNGRVIEYVERQGGRAELTDAGREFFQL